MKKNKTMRIASLLLVLALLTTCFVGTTFAKYTSSAEGTDVAQVAKWDISVNDTQITVPNPNVSFNLFSTIVDTVDGQTDADVTAGKIAPGTKGAFSLKVTNDSEVSATYTISLAVAQPAGYTIPIKFYSDEAMQTEIQPGNDGKYVFTGEKLDPVGGTTAEATSTLYWKWVFEGGTAEADAADTALGIAAATGTAPELSVTTNITVTQVD